MRPSRDAEAVIVRLACARDLQTAYIDIVTSTSARTAAQHAGIPDMAHRNLTTGRSNRWCLPSSP
jgi:hypothetical protein